MNVEYLESGIVILDEITPSKTQIEFYQIVRQPTIYKGIICKVENTRKVKINIDTSDLPDIEKFASLYRIISEYHQSPVFEGHKPNINGYYEEYIVLTYNEFKERDSEIDPFIKEVFEDLSLCYTLKNNQDEK